MGVSELRNYEKYVDLPTLVRRSTRTSFEYIKERVWKKLQAWEEKLLLEVEREIFSKAIVQAIHTYTISCFKLSLGLCIDLESLVRKFWWGQRGDRRKIHWVKLSKIHWVFVQ